MSIGKSAVKINPPRTGGIYSRTTLIQQLQAVRPPPLVWISAPAGAGKTTLIADYLASQAIPALWYQLDAGDTDPATFFHYLALASYRLCKQDLPLPKLTPEYHGNLATFTRRFTERLCAGIKPPAVFVFDDFQDLPTDSPLQPLFREVIAALPDGFRAFFLSREQAPAWVAGFAARHAAYFMDRDRLRLTEEEAIGIVHLLGNDAATCYSDAEIRRIHQTVDGWAAGLILMCRAWQHNPTLTPPLDDERSHALIFDYFASELFERLDAEKQAFLLQSALLPVMPMAQVCQLTGHPHTEYILQELYARNFFITRATGQASVYKYHPLFREFLLKQGRERWKSEQLDSLHRQAAQVLLEAGQPEAALELALSGSDWQTAAPIIISHATQLIAQGRYQTLLGWLQRLPETLLITSPWLLYWQGIALDGYNPVSAERSFTSAFPLFELHGDVTGMYLTIAGVLLMSWMTQQNHHGMDVWLQRFDQLYAAHPDISPPATEARVMSAVLMGISYRRPDHPQAEHLLARARYLWALPLEANLRWQLGSAIGFYIAGRGDLISWGKTVRLYEAAGNTGVAPLEQLHLQLSLAFIDCFVGHYAASKRYVQQGLALGDNSGVHVYDLFLLAVGVYNGLMQAKLADADSHLNNMRQILATQAPNFHTVHYRLLLNWRALVAGDFAEAVMHGRAALELAKTNGAVYPLARCRHALALALFVTGERVEALTLLEQAQIPWGASRYQQLVYDCGLSAAWFRLQMGDENTAETLLVRALQQGKTQGWGLPLWSFPVWMEALLGFALERGIDTPHVQRLIQQAEWLPTQADSIPCNWPMPVKIHTLGDFAVEVGGKRLSLENASPNRPLELLKVLIAFGGREVAAERLMDVLWPDASGDAATRSLHTTLHRLRKLLGVEQAIVLKDRVISLDPRYVWLDVWVLERLLGQLRQQLDSQHPNADGVRRLWSIIRSLYGGSFLGQGAQRSWTLDLAERLRSRMIRFTQAVGTYWEQAADWEQAIQTYRKGLEIDPLIETFYQHLMQAYVQFGKPSEALAAYERCREVLGKGLGVMPGSVTVKLYNAIRAEAAAD